MVMMHEGKERNLLNSSFPSLACPRGKGSPQESYWS